jgi:oxygen-independent coproporphyrinogen-3 oxidase
MLGIYIHIPYCRTVCPYCDFVRKGISGKVPESYMQALCSEITAFEGGDEAGSVFIGGGTPSLIDTDHLEALLETLRARFQLGDAEITLEANPDDVSAEGLRRWRGMGINRISLGVQSFDDRVLQWLGRRHDARKAIEACEAVSAAFSNWNLDLIFGAKPSDAWRATLDQCLALSPPHVAAYGLTYEAGTPFETRAPDALDEDEVLSLFRETEAALSAYEHYEISNFAKAGLESRHNLIYWHNEAYAGFGTAAYSFIKGVRARNLIDTQDYVKRPGEKVESLSLSPHEVRIETLIQHFRLQAGLNKASYTRRFRRSLDADFGEVLGTLIKRGLLVEDEFSIRPTEKGFYLNNEIGLALV